MLVTRGRSAGREGGWLSKQSEGHPLPSTHPNQLSSAEFLHESQQAKQLLLGCPGMPQRKKEPERESERGWTTPPHHQPTQLHSFHLSYQPPMRMVSQHAKPNWQVTQKGKAMRDVNSGEDNATCCWANQQLERDTN